MFKEHLQNKTKAELNPGLSTTILRKAAYYLKSLEQQLDIQIDKRLVRTFFDLFIAILLFRHRESGLLLSELGAYICGPAHAPAGTKRISNLLRSEKWRADLIDHFLFERTKKRIEQITQAGKRALLLWDDSQLEKPESWFLEGLCSVFSSKAKRLIRMKPGFYNPPTSRVCVPGFKWSGVMLSALGEVPSVCQMSWWTTRGKFKEDPDNITFRLLKKIQAQLGRLTHVLDRGYANSKMLEYLFLFEQDFIIRWKKNHCLEHAQKGL